MSNLILPEGYSSVIGVMENQRAIKNIKDYFQKELAFELKLLRVSAPLFVAPETGLNDNLNGNYNVNVNDNLNLNLDLNLDL